MDEVIGYINTLTLTEQLLVIIVLFMFLHWHNNSELVAYFRVRENFIKRLIFDTIKRIWKWLIG